MHAIFAAKLAILIEPPGIISLEVSATLLKRGRSNKNRHATCHCAAHDGGTSRGKGVREEPLPVGMFAPGSSLVLDAHQQHTCVASLTTHSLALPCSLSWNSKGSHGRNITMHPHALELNTAPFRLSGCTAARYELRSM